MTAIIRSPVTHTATVLTILFFLIAWAVPNKSLLEALRILQVSVSLVVVIAYLPDAIDGLRQGQPDRAHQLSMGICLGFFSILCNGAYSIIWRLAGTPDWLTNSALNGFWVYLSILAGILHVTAPGSINGSVPRQNWIYIGLGFGSGALVAAFVMVAHPDLRDVILQFKPYLAE
jgi:hypothetical protein